MLQFPGGMGDVPHISAFDAYGADLREQGFFQSAVEESVDRPIPRTRAEEILQKWSADRANGVTHSSDALTDMLCVVSRARSGNSVQAFSPGFSARLELLLEDIKSNPPSDPHKLADGLGALARLRVKGSDVVERLLDDYVEVAMTSNRKDLAFVVWSLTKLEERYDQHLDKLLDIAKDQMIRFSSRELTVFVSSCAGFQHRDESVLKEWAKAVDQKIATRERSTFSSVAVALSLKACAELNFSPERTIDALLGELVREEPWKDSKLSSARHWISAESLRALGELNYRSPYFDSLAEDIVQRKSPWDGASLRSALFGLAVLDPEKGREFWSNVSRAGGLPGNVSDGQLLGLYHSMRVIGIDIPAGVESDVQAISQFKKRHPHEPSGFERRVRDWLEHRGFVCQPQVVIDGYSVDLLAVHVNSGRRALIECDGVRFHQVNATPDGRPTGSTLLKNRFLKSRGHDVLHISDFEWHTGSFPPDFKAFVFG